MTRTTLLAAMLFSAVAFAQDAALPPPPPPDAQPAAAATGTTSTTVTPPDAAASSEGAAADAAAAPAAAPQTADEQFDVRVKTMEEQVNDLKEKIFRTKARLLLLQESVLGGGSVSQGSKAVLVHRNEMGSSFVLKSVAYALDGAPVYTKVDVDGDLDKREEFEIFNGRIVPGQHQIAVKYEFRGHGYGVFSYLEGYKFSVQSSYTFDAEAGKVTTVKVVAYEKGNIATDLKDRPAVRYDLERATDGAMKKDEKISGAEPSASAAEAR